MGLREQVQAGAVEQRVIAGVPWRPWDSPSMRYDVGGPIHPTRSVFGVDESLGLPALYSAVKLLSDNASSLPIHTYQHLGSASSINGGMSRTRWWGPTIFDKPSVLLRLGEWISTLMTSVLLQGNAWGFVTGRDGYGYPTGIEWIPPHDIHVIEPEDHQSWNPLTAQVFAYGRQVRWHGPDSEMFHIKGMPLAGRIEGISPMRAFALTILAGREAQRYGSDWYQSGGFPPGTFQNAEIEIDVAQAAEIRAELVKSLRRREPLVYGRDWDYKPVTVPPSEAQFIDAMQLNATQIAAVYNVPPDRIGGTRGDSLTYNTVVQASLEIIESLRPWLVRMEQAFFELLPKQRMAEFWTDALLKTDLASRMTIYGEARNNGIMTVNEIRQELGREPFGPIGDEQLPLTTMNAMGTRAGVIPKSFMKAVVLEMDVATDRLIKLEKYIIPQLVAQGYPVQGVTPPPAPPTPPGGGSGTPAKKPAAGASKPAANKANAGRAAGGFGGGAAQPGNTTYPITVNGVTGTPIGMPNAPLPLSQDPASFLASLISVQRDASMPYEARVAAQDFLVAIAERADNIRKYEPDEEISQSDLYAPSVRSRPDLEDRINDDKRRGHL
jgi:HK97 family phage portal protein